MCPNNRFTKVDMIKMCLLRERYKDTEYTTNHPHTYTVTHITQRLTLNDNLVLPQFHGSVNKMMTLDCIYNNDAND